MMGFIEEADGDIKCMYLHCIQTRMHLSASEINLSLHLKYLFYLFFFFFASLFIFTLTPDQSETLGDI